MYFKIFLIGYLEGIVDDTDLAERISDSIAIREFLGYGLSERPPDHSSIGRVRGAFGKDEALSSMLDDTVNRCAEAGLIDGKLVCGRFGVAPCKRGYGEPGVHEDVE